MRHLFTLTAPASFILHLLAVPGLLLLSGLPLSLAAAPELRLTGEATQGSLLRGKTRPGASVELNGTPVTVAVDGTFVLGFGREAALEQTLRIDGHAFPLRLSAREYQIQRIDGIEQKFVTPPESEKERIAADARAAKKARAYNSDWVAFTERFLWPATGRISGVYGSQRILNGKPSRPHYGLDIAAPTGTPVYAPAGGKVRLVLDMYYSGITVILDHGHGVSSTFLHLHKAVAEQGDWLEQGQQLGEVGSTGRSTGAHLDWRVNWFDTRLDPQLLVPAMGRE